MSDRNPAWHAFAALQNVVDPLTVDRSLARDEALDAVLADVAADYPQSDGVIQKRFYSLCRNRLSKQNYRRKLDTRRFRPTHRRGGAADGAVLLVPSDQNVIDQLAYRQLEDLILTVLPLEDFQILLEIAAGHSYADIAMALRTTPSGIKARVFRMREKVRNSHISSILRCWPRRFA